MSQPQLPGAPGRRPRSRGWVFWVVLALMVITPIVEVMLIVKTGQAIGAIPTLLILLATSAVGAWLAKREGGRAWRALTDSFGSGKLPSGELADAALVLSGGLLLLLPGFVTDVVGLVFLLPFTRPLARRLLGWLANRYALGKGVDLALLRAKTQPGSVIEGETVADLSDPQPSRPQSGDDIVIRGEIET